LIRGQVPGFFGEDTESAWHKAGFRLQWNGCVEPHRTDVAGDEGIVREPFILPCVGNNGPLPRVEDLRAHGVFARADAAVHTPSANLVLGVRADDVDYPERNTAQFGGQAHQVLEGAGHCGIGQERRIEGRVQSVFTQGGVPAGFIGERQLPLCTRHQYGPQASLGLPADDTQEVAVLSGGGLGRRGTGPRTEQDRRSRARHHRHKVKPTNRNPRRRSHALHRRLPERLHRGA
jgi:hypothetical protein